MPQYGQVWHHGVFIYVQRHPREIKYARSDIVLTSFDEPHVVEPKHERRQRPGKAYLFAHREPLALSLRILGDTYPHKLFLES